MADLKLATDFVLTQEDSLLAGRITTLPGDSGGATRFGISSAAHPELVAQGFFVADANGKPEIGQCAALSIAEEIYANQYASPLLLDRIVNQDVANRLLSFAINEGPPQAIRIAQRACNELGCWLAVDGRMGPSTLNAINSVNPQAWIAANRALQADFYRNLVTERPEMEPLLKGLLNRANA